MSKDDVIARLRGSEASLRALGIERLSIFGSVARDEASEVSDIDLAAHLDRSRRIGLFRLADIEARIAALLGMPVDLITEPSVAPRVQERIDRDRVRVF